MTVEKTKIIESLMLIALFLITSLISFTAASDSVIEGSEHPDLHEAIEIWLQNNDENSLPTIAKLARDGNTAARLLLSRIERTERAPSSYLESLTIKQQKALFRNPENKGVFQPSWMLTEAESGNSIAALFLSSYVPRVDLATIHALRQAGEFEATDHPVRIAALYGDIKIKKALLDELATPQMRPFVISQLPPAKPIADGLAALEYMKQFGQKYSHTKDIEYETKAAARFLALGIPYGDVSRTNPWRSVVSNWLMYSTEAAPIRKTCEAHCANDVEECGITLLGLTGGYYEAIRLDSPMENLISQSTFLHSERAAAQALRRGALIRAEHGGEIASIQQIAHRSQCLAKWVKLERQSTMYQATRN